MRLDVPRILRKYGVAYIDSHPSVSSECVGVDCPFCGDKNKHMGVFLDKGNFTCWKCGAGGGFFKLLRELTDITWEEFAAETGIEVVPVGNTQEALRAILCPDTHPTPQNTQRLPSLDVDLQSLRVAEPGLHPLIDRFMEERGFTPDIFPLYGLRFGIAGRLMNHLVIPVPPPFMWKDGKPDAYAARTLFHTKHRKWQFPYGVDMHNYCYVNMPLKNGEPFAIVEGIFDAWSIEGAACALFGTKITPAQLGILSQYPDSDVTVILDGDAKIQGMKIAEKIRAFFPSVKTLYLPERYDPNDLLAEGNPIHFTKGRFTWSK